MNFLLLRVFYLRQLVRYPFGSGPTDFQLSVGCQRRYGQEVPGYPGWELRRETWAGHRHVVVTTTVSMCDLLGRYIEECRR